jgi:putative DNA primase/helicase
MTSLRTTAARLTSLGIGIVPLHWVREDGSCSCGDPDCKSIGKHPITKHGASEPILDPEAATRQWDQTPNANVGIQPGSSRLVAVDLDSEAARDRFRSIADAATLEAMRNAPTVKTGKGWHIYFADPRVEYAPTVGKHDDVGIDIRAGVSILVAPPSIHASGHEYRWLQGEPPFDAPAVTPWLDDYIKRRKEEKEPTIVDEGFTVGEGSRADFIVEMAGVLRRRGMNEAEICGAMIPLNRRVNAPPLDDREVIKHVRGICSYQPSDVPDSFRVASTSIDDLLGRLQHLDTATLVNDAPPIIEWVWDDYMAPGTLNMLHGDGGLGKSYLSLKIAEQMSRPEGGELFGKKIHPGGVVILDGENAAVQIHHRIHNTTIAADANLHVFTVDQPILGYEDKTNAIFQHIADVYDPRLVIIDSQRALWAGDEKEQMEVGRMLRAFAKGLEAFPYATLLLHHDNRGKDYAGSSDMNAAISGARLHLEKHGGKDETQARRLSMPKNRIGPEMRPQEFFLTIETQPRSHRFQISGIGIRAYESNAETMAAELVEQAKTKILNQTCTSEELWAAFGWEVKNHEPQKREHRDVWKIVKQHLEDAGYVHGRVQGNGNRYLWRAPNVFHDLA